METGYRKETRSAPPGAPVSDETPAAERPWLTVETAAYALIALAALVVRLAALGRWPLLSSELDTALSAWRGAQGTDWRAPYYVPLLYDAHLLVFGLTRATDAAARLLPALVGTALTLLPYWTRELLGRKGALAAALLLAFTPTWVFMSRTADGAILATACAAVLLWAAYRYSQEPKQGYLGLGAVALGIGLTAGPQFYTALLAGLALWLYRRRRVAAGAGRPAAARLDASALWTRWRTPALLALGVWLFVASGFLTNLGGIGASAGLLGRWFEDLAPRSSGLGWLSLPRQVLGYEFLTIALAAVALGRGLRRRDAIDGLLAAWVALALLLGTALGHRQPAWALDALLPLVLLAGRGAERLWDALVSGATRGDGLALLAAVPFVVFVFLQVATYTHTGQEPYLRYALVGLGILVVAWVAYWIWGATVPALRVGAGIVLLVMLAFTTRITTAVAFQTGRDPREGLVQAPTSVQMRDLEALVAQTASRQAGDPRLLDLRYDASLEPWLGWYLRDSANARVAEIDFGALARTALITPLLSDAEWPAGYAGQRFWLTETFDGRQLTRRERLLWWIYREPVSVAQPTEIVFWVKLA
ncbi:MAG: hypothetical protein GX557_08940, partial [Chloroflexi bacterium]|nr:hypothetical protein [Chloroflexota bacterium]